MQENKRLDYLDSLRGVAMLCVIYYHICIYLLGDSTAINDSLVRWRMPLFFFISGFFAFAPIFDVPLVKRRLKNRLFQQLYPTIVVWVLFIVCSWLLSTAPFKEHMLYGIYDPAKVGYWFTFSLVQVFVLYVLFAYTLSSLNVAVKQQTVIYFIVIAAFGLLSLLTFDDAAMSGAMRKVWNVLSLGKTIKLVAFFFGGAIVRMHWQSIYRLMRNYWFVGGSLAMFVVTSYLTPAGEADSASLYFISRISGLMFIVSLFICLEKYVDHTTLLGRYLQRIGRNTLPIYLFHFFILLLVPCFIDDISAILNQLSVNPVIELVSFTVISVVFAEITLAVDSLLKLRPFAHKVIFAK